MESQQIAETFNTELEHDGQESLSPARFLTPFLYGLDALLDNGLKVRLEFEALGKVML